MIKYLVVTFGGMDGLKFPDLLVKYSTGYLLPLHVKEGEYVPLEILDPLDVKKSLIVGSLGRYLKGGQVIEEDDEIPKELPKQIIKELPKKPILDVKQTTQEIVPTSKEKVEEQSLQTDSKIKEESPLTDLSQVKTIEDFFRLGYFLKLKYIKDCADKVFLQQILEKTDSKQLSNNIALRLTQL